MAPPPLEADVQASMDRTVRDGLRLASLVLGVLLLAFVFVDPLLVPAHDAQVAFADLLASALFFACHLLLRRETWPAGRAHLLGGAMALAVVVNVTHDSVLLGDPTQATYLILSVVGAGALFLSTRWTVVVVAASLAGFGLAVAAHPEAPGWLMFGASLVAACVLALLIHEVRRRTITRLERLRLADAKRKEQLELRERALESAVDALQKSEERYRRLVEEAPDAFLVHSGGRIVYVNAAAVKLFGAERAEDLLGRDSMSLVHPEDLGAVRERNRLIEREGVATEPREMRALRLDGTTVHVEVIGRPITYLGQPADQTLLRDVTDRKRAEEERVVAAARLAEIGRLQEMDRVKTQFVNTISHELRTPLTPIRVQLHILKEATTPEQARKATQVLERNVLRLNGLVDELLEVARIQAGRLSLVKADVDLSRDLHHTLESFVDVARQNGVELVWKVEPDLRLQGDAKRLTQVMYNLLGNAFKFTPRGGRVVVEAAREGDAVTVRVRDSGAGLTSDDIGRLFEPFSQAHDPMEKTNAGTGLGLYICRGIVEGHGGRIWAESDGPGRGASFVFTVPLLEAQPS